MPDNMIAYVLNEFCDEIDSLYREGVAAGTDLDDAVIVIRYHGGRPPDLETAMRQVELEEHGEVPVDINLYKDSFQVESLRRSADLQTLRETWFFRHGYEHSFIVIVEVNDDQPVLVFWPIPK